MQYYTTLTNLINSIRINLYNIFKYEYWQYLFFLDEGYFIIEEYHTINNVKFIIQ